MPKTVELKTVPPAMSGERDHSMALELCKQAELDWPKLGFETFVATWNERPYDRSRTDAEYAKFNDEVYSAALGDHLPNFLRAIERHSREDMQAAVAHMSVSLVSTYRTAHIVGGRLHVNSGEEEVAQCVRLLAAHGWYGPEQAVIAMWLQPGEKIEEVHFDRIVTNLNRTLSRPELATLSGQHPRTFTDPAVVEELEMNAARDRAAQQAGHPATQNYYTTRDGRRLHLADVENRERD